LFIISAIASTPMPDFPIRKIVVVTEEIRHDGGPVPKAPQLRAAAIAVVRNPFAGTYVEDLQPAMDDLNPLALELTDRLITALGGDGAAITGYGKACIVGSAGELEHGALWGVPGGYGMRGRITKSKAIVPWALKVGGMGQPIDVPLGHANAAYVRSHFDTMTVMVQDAPKPDEIVFVNAMMIGGRIHSRMGGLETWQVKGEDGLR
jgi:hypothetical protein